MKEIQLIHAGAEPVGKIPERKVPIPDMIDDGAVLHNILLRGIRTNIRKEKDRLAKNIGMISDTGRDHHQEDQEGLGVLSDIGR